MVALSVVQNSSLPEEQPDNNRVLVVDNDPAYAQLLSRYVRSFYKNFDVEICSTSRDAIRLCIENQYKILLIDYNLPDLTGSKFLHKLQSKIDGLPPPAIILTAEGGAAAACEALRANAYDFLPKRLVSPESLERSMHNAMSRHSLKQSVQLRTHELETANRSLREKSREIQEFYQTVSHEVKTPLSASREFVSLVRDGVLGSVSDEQAEALDYALAGCDQIASHFNDLIEMTRLDAGKITLHKKNTTVGSLIARTIAGCARRIEDKNISFTSYGQHDDTTLDVDSDRINQVLSNLLSNAVKYTPEHGAISITCKGSTGKIQFCVEDNGCGICETELDSIFKRLFQCNQENSDMASPGLGLGLSIAREIVVLHGGNIWVESELGKGSRFFVELPVEN